MEGQNQIRGQQWLLPETDRVPRLWAILLAVIAQLAGLGVLLLPRHTETVHIVPPDYKTAHIISGADHVVFDSINRSLAPDVGRGRSRRATRPAPIPMTGSAAQDASIQPLRKQAKRATAAIVRSFRFRQIYGFSPNDEYLLAARTGGEVPSISADEVPPRFEQYVTVEITIDAEGRVSEARIVAGVVPGAIEQKLLSAIRELKYSPATRDGVPIPSQLDIVIRIPS